MIFENYNRGILVSSLENCKIRLHGRATAIIMQIQTNTVITNEEGIRQYLAMSKEIDNDYRQTKDHDPEIWSNDFAEYLAEQYKGGDESSSTLSLKNIVCIGKTCMLAGW